MKCIEYQSVCPFVGIGPPPPPASVSPSLDPNGEEQHSLSGEGGWGDPIRTGKESLALYLLCGTWCMSSSFTRVAVTVTEGHTVTHA
jgi:hypothetical protein